MPATHEIDDHGKLITTSWYEAAVDSALIESLSKYQREIRSLPQYASYNEILDFTQATTFKLSTQGIRELVEIAVKGDAPSVRTKLAIVVTSPVAFGLARMYQTYRSFAPNASKEVHIFKNLAEALEWIAK
jgi:hypothetical protein